MLKFNKLLFKADLYRVIADHVIVENSNQQEYLESILEKFMDDCEDRIQIFMSNEDYETMMDAKD